MMMQRRRAVGFRAAFVMVGLSALWSATPAAAETYIVDGIPMELSFSPGLCPISRADPDAAALYAGQDRIHEGRNSVVVIALACAGDIRLDPTTYAIWMVTGPKDRPTVVPERYSRADIIGELSRTSDTFDFDAVSRLAEEKLKSHDTEVDVQRMGKVAEDAAGFYIAILQDVAQDGEAATVSGVVGATLLHHRILTYNMYTDYRGEETYGVLLPEVKRVLARTVEVNPE